MPWNLVYNQQLQKGVTIDTAVLVSVGQWIAVGNQDLPAGSVELWGVIKIPPALPTILGVYPVMNQVLCYDRVTCYYGQTGIGTNSRVHLYLTQTPGTSTVPVSIFRWS